MSTRDLAQLLRDDPSGVVVVTGAGVTLGALEPGSDAFVRATWKGLLEHGLRFAQDRRALTAPDADRLRVLLQSERACLWIAAAECLSDALSAPRGGEFAAWLHQAVGGLAGAVRQRAVLDVLVELERRGAVLATVNYDSVLEAATGRPPITWREPAKVQRVLRGDARGIVHLHGSWEDPESVVLGTMSYAAMLADRRARTALEMMAMGRTFVFVGHGAGLDDLNWSRLFQWMSEVLVDSPYRHYRIVGEAELPQFDDPRLQARRVQLVPYSGGYARLGPFLRKLVGRPGEAGTQAPEPARLARSAEPRVRHVLVLLNIGGDDHDPITASDALRAARVEQPTKTLELGITLEPRDATADDWRRVRAALDTVIGQIKALGGDDACFLLAGRAPLPVFAYLGLRTQRLTGEVLMVGHHGGAWERIGPYRGPQQFPVGASPRFTLLEQPTGPVDAGRNVLFVGCSSSYRCSLADLVAVVGPQPERTTALCTVRSNKHHQTDPMTDDDLAPLSELFGIAIRSLGDADLHGTGLVVALGGPAWVAYWLGRQINRNVVGSVEFPNFVQGRGYVPAIRTLEIGKGRAG